MGYAIRAEGVTKSYGEGEARVEVLKGVDLALRAGEVVAIMGPSGSGKTTLLHVLGLVTEPTAGRLVLDGEDICGGGSHDLQRLRREKLGFIFQFANLIPFLSARENVLLMLEVAGMQGGEAGDRAEELLDYLGVAGRGDQMPESLSGGERQRVAIARALANDPKVILADEPTASLDAERGLGVMRLLRKLADERGTAVVVVTHDTRMLGEVDRVIRLVDGRVEADPPPAPAATAGRGPGGQDEEGDSFP
ncbi:MAG: ABC transporter ATP-binding protein [Gemmataceae bacterium]|nr:ABC transporter ATP-binding protein [Gemmataceae bacterium]